MRAPRVFAGVIGVTIAVVLGLIILYPRTPPNPPVLSLVSLEPAGVFDDSGVEMSLLRLSISNSDNRPFNPANSIYVKDGGRCIEVKVANHWIAAEGTVGALGFCALAPLQKHEIMFILPASGSCRVWFKYTGATLSTKHRLAWVAERLPECIRFRMSYKFWRWVGFTRYMPSSNWREINVELPLRPV